MAHYKYISIAFLSLLLSIIIVCSVFQYSNGYRVNSNIHQYSSSPIDEKYWREFEEFREWKKLRNQFSRNTDPPPSDHPALVGRYVVNQANWASVATISVRDEINSYPFANVVAMSDGPIGHGVGVPYVYLTPLDFTTKDWKANPRVTFMITLAQGQYCQQKGMDPIDPRCARIILSGEIKKIVEKDAEHDIAKSFIFDRHPALQFMPPDHKFFFGKLKMHFIAVLDTFGGAKIVDVKDYFNPHRVHNSTMSLVPRVIRI